MKSILVTGGAGFIGSHTCLSLLMKGYNLYIVDSFVNSSKLALKQVSRILREEKINAENKLNFFEGDIRDKLFLKKVFSRSIIEKKPIEGVLHFAGLKSVSESVKNPIMYWNSNLVATLNLVEIMLDFDCSTIVFSSSATIYGKLNESPIK